MAAATGYYDQAHLTQEFVRSTGVTPRAWVAEEFGNIQDGSHAGRPEWDHDQLEPDGMAHPAGF
ncbi:hypothetical protein GCM10023322_07530 [Rugosimonospora acidiphila]|uniref:HTH araC/xylS-type domain-containing protein n=1 Tax=Rugosimonospora acidiphila TaxID=556531 RepID=A0ABP9RL89_9ACTN